MAFNEFYFDTGGNDVNSGSSAATTAAYTSTNGNWNGTTTFTPTDGSTPANSVNVGDWLSIYLDGATVAVYCAQVTAVAAGVNGAITVSTTNKFGSVPTSGATGRSIKCGGAWASPRQLLASGKALFGATGVALRFNIKAGTYANTTNDVSISTTGTVTAPMWWRGYNTTIGDCDTNNSLTKPVISFTTGRFALNACAFNAFSSLDITGAAITTGQLITSNTTANNCRFYRCRITNTSTNAGANAIGTANNITGMISFVSCYIKSSSASGQTINIANNTSMAFIGCTIETGTSSHGAAVALSTGIVAFISCVFMTNGGDGIRNTGGTNFVVIVGCTFNTCGSDSIEFATAAPTMAIVANCLFADSGAYDINNSIGTNQGQILRAGNLSYSPGTAAENGFGDLPAFAAQTDSASPFVSGSDLTPASTSNARNHALPGAFENQSFTSYADIGAIDHADPATAVPYHGAMAGGMQ